MLLSRQLLTPPCRRPVRDRPRLVHGAGRLRPRAGGLGRREHRDQPAGLALRRHHGDRPLLQGRKIYFQSIKIFVQEILSRLGTCTRRASRTPCPRPSLAATRGACPPCGSTTYTPCTPPSSGPSAANMFCTPANISILFCRAAAYNESSCGDLTARRRLRESLKCHSFDWFLTNVYPELQLPGDGDKSFG